MAVMHKMGLCKPGFPETVIEIDDGNPLFPQRSDNAQSRAFKETVLVTKLKSRRNDDDRELRIAR
mgnify:FL=1